MCCGRPANRPLGDPRLRSAGRRCGAAAKPGECSATAVSAVARRPGVQRRPAEALCERQDAPGYTDGNRAAGADDLELEDVVNRPDGPIRALPAFFERGFLWPAISAVFSIQLAVVLRRRALWVGYPHRLGHIVVE